MLIRRRTFASTSITIVIILALLSTMTIQNLDAQLALPPGVKREETVIFDVQISSVANPDNWNPWVIGTQATVIGVNQVCMSPLYYTDYKDGVTKPWVAEDLPTYSPDFRELIIRIRRGIYWSDGTPFTARDIVYAINVTKANSRLGPHATVNAWIDAAWIVDDYALAIRLKTPNPYIHFMLFTLIGPGIYNYMMPKHYFDARGVTPENAHTFLYNPPLCIGPYTLHSYDPGGTWFLWKRRDDWDRSSIKPLYDRKIVLWAGPKYVMFRVFKTETDKVIAMARGELDWIFDATWQAWESLKRMLGDRVQAWLPYYPYFWGYDTTVRGIYFNNMRYPYNITEVRWALTLAINMTEVMTLGYKGVQRMTVVPGAAAWPTEAFLTYTLLLDDLLKMELVLPNKTRIRVYDPSIPFKVYRWARVTGLLTKELTDAEIRWSWGAGWWRYAPDAAEQILRNLRFSRGPDGKWRLPDGTPWKMKLNIPAGFEYDAIDLGLAVAEQWRKFGIDVEVIPLEAAAFWVPQLNNGAFEVGSYWGISGNDPTALPIHFETWRCAYVRPIGEYAANGVRYCNRKFDEALLRALANPPGSSEAVAALKEAVLTMIRDMPVAWAGNCKKLLPILTDYFTNWPSAYNFYTGIKPWGNQMAQQVIGNLIPVKTAVDTPTSRPVNEPPPGTITFPTLPEEAMKKLAEAMARPTPTPSPTPSPTPTPRPTPTPSPTPSPTPTPRPTPTPSPTPSPTPTPGIVTVTVTSITTAVVTSTSMVTATRVETVTSTKIETVVEWTTPALIAAVLLIVGVAVGYIIKRK